MWGCCWWEGLTVGAKVLAGESHFFQRYKKRVSFFSRQSVQKEQRKSGSGGGDWDVTHCLDLSAVSFPLMALSPALKRLSRGGETREVARTQTREQISESLRKLKTLKASSVPKNNKSNHAAAPRERRSERFVWKGQTSASAGGCLQSRILWVLAIPKASVSVFSPFAFQMNKDINVCNLFKSVAGRASCPAEGRKQLEKNCLPEPLNCAAAASLQRGSLWM